MPYDIGHDEKTSDHVYNYPECLEAQCHSGFFHREYGHTRTIFIGFAHDMASGPGPDAFDASYHGRLNHMAQATPADHAIAITAYLIFLRRDILDQVLAMLFPV
jgi:hypothetical protein